MSGYAETMRQLRGGSSLLWAVAGVSVFTNLLMLTGPIFMLQIYDRVLSSRSEATLVALFAVVSFLYIIFGVLDHARTRIAARFGAQLQNRLDVPVFRAALAAGKGRAGDGAALRAPQDVALLAQLSGSQVFMALFDFPWVPLFILVIALLHPWLGVLALASAILLAGLSFSNMALNRRAVQAGQALTQHGDALGRQISRDGRQMRALGMLSDALDRWAGARTTALVQSLGAQDATGRFASTSRALRLFLQSAMLALGAWLVLQSQLSAGAMIAASIILGRALAPLDQVIGGWAYVQAARDARGRLLQVLAEHPEPPARTRLPDVKGALSVKALSLRAPGASGAEGVILRDLSFSLAPGEALGVIGPSGAGKTALAEALVGIWPAAAGEIRLDGALLSQFDPAQLGQALGYLPQRATLFEGSLRDNIARLDPKARDEAVIAAAQAAGAHDLILSFPQGYETQIDADGGWLSGGQVQRIALARALYRSPALLVLDEPNSNLDELGTRALNAAISAAKQAGAGVVIMAHRPSAITACDRLMLLDRGRMLALGPTEEILRKVTRNGAEILDAHRKPSDSATKGAAFPWEAAKPGNTQ